MEIDPSYIEKFRPAGEKKSGTPRSNRDVIIDDFLRILNTERKLDGYAPFTFARVAKMLEGRSDTELFKLFNLCTHPSVKRFGAMLNYKLKNRT